ncbi:hypothetical protein CspeluHIS016_0900030 [Cutaneotrichosporon spelunceum]|uniref:Uncharacterized protein n=1 Tax=Cutaneotrichosporon spelunceum TaxID=1672016 RepID=A0AAD3TZJ2_9TREE|nr:hypothetical protein CspeluHIS016_0900030 [Cutaneotrichosporon spelunceum]
MSGDGIASARTTLSRKSVCDTAPWRCDDMGDETEDPREWPFPDTSTSVGYIVFTTREAYAATLDPQEHLLETTEELESNMRDPSLSKRSGGRRGFLA